MECLFVARKQERNTNARFNLVGLWERTEKWKEKTVKQITEMAKKGVCHSSIGIVKQIPQRELLPERSALSGLILRLDLDYNAAWKSLEDVISPYIHLPILYT
ncbi:MAG TPA: hypothetical protein VFJ05_05185 [Nitrososphaeraceae archaeon]|nr:hypothetical protein [Nitrososphaeraceae archaeon]